MAPINPQIVHKNGIKILLTAEIRGELSKLNQLAQEYQADIIIHTGNFGFFDENSIERIHESYLRHIVEFSPLLSNELLTSISKLSKVSGDNVEHLSNDQTNLRSLLVGHPISELCDFLTNNKKLNVPVYTVSGMCEDSVVLNKFKYGIYQIPNLHIIDEDHLFNIKTDDGTNILLFGLGGSLSYHKLFHHGAAIDLDKGIDDINIVPVSGDPGNIWITMLQLGKFIDNVTKFTSQNTELVNQSIKIFLTHQSPTREPLLEHLSIFFKADYTISDGLHFKYPSSYNELSINPNFENFKFKFIESRLKLSVIWSKISKKFLNLLENITDKNELHNLIKYTSLALDVYDKIPVSTKNHEEILPIKLNLTEADDAALAKIDINSILEDPTSAKVLSSIIRQLNDLYYLSFQNTWHFNLCDLTQGTLVLQLTDGNISMKTHSTGFNFEFRKSASVLPTRGNNGFSRRFSKEDDEDASNGSPSKDRNKPFNSSYRGRGDHRGRGRGGYGRGRGRGRGGYRGTSE